MPNPYAKTDRADPMPLRITCSCGCPTFFLGYSLGGAFGMPFLVICTKCGRKHGGPEHGQEDDPLKSIASTFRKAMDPDQNEPWKRGD